jgi:hypothetical protein
MFFFSFAKMSSEDEDVLAAINIVNYLNYNQNSTVLKYWVHPFCRKNCYYRGVYSILKELDDPDHLFKSFYRMEKSKFEELVRLVGPDIQKKHFLLCSTRRQRIDVYEFLRVTNDKK